MKCECAAPDAAFRECPAVWDLAFGDLKQSCQSIRSSLFRDVTATHISTPTATHTHTDCDCDCDCDTDTDTHSDCDTHTHSDTDCLIIATLERESSTCPTVSSGSHHQEVARRSHSRFLGCGCSHLRRKNRANARLTGDPKHESHSIRP
jgi:hypothetical protein